MTRSADPSPAVPLPPFSGDATVCDKCGHVGAHTHYSATQTFGGTVVREFLERSCHRCDYTWHEATVPAHHIQQIRQTTQQKETPLTLGELLARLEAADPNLLAPQGFTGPHCYRAHHDQLAFEPAANVTVAHMREQARSALGATYTAIKGGEYTMTADTECWLAPYGMHGETLGPTLLDLMLAAATPAPTLRDRVEEALHAPVPCPNCGRETPCRCMASRTPGRIDAIVAAVKDFIR